MTEPLWNSATISRRRDLNERVAIFHVAPHALAAPGSDGEPDAARVPAFTPGQFIQIGLPQDPDPDGEQIQRVRWIKRAYSIASAPHEHAAYELCIAHVATGLLTQKLWTLGEGSTIWTDNTPKGTFTLDRIPTGVDLVTVATGTGVAPFVSMLRETRDADRWRRFVVIHGVRECSDLAYDDELREHARRDERVKYVPIVSRETGPWDGLRGRVQVALEEQAFLDRAGFPLDRRESHVLLCGNPDMIKDVREVLAPRGFVADTVKVPGNLHFERYW